MAKKVKPHMINVQDVVFGVVLNCAVRYAVGRKTYMPGLVIDFITPLVPHLNDKSYLYEIFWKWCVSSGYTPISKQGFSRHIMQTYPMLKTVPTKQADGYARIIRLRGK